MLFRKATKTADEAQPTEATEAPPTPIASAYEQDAPAAGGDLDGLEDLELDHDEATGPESKSRTSKLAKRLLAPRDQKTPRPKGTTPGKWRLRGVGGNLTVSKTGKVTAWFLSRNVSWSYRTQGDASLFIESLAEALAAFEEPNVHMRITQRPFPVSEWAERSWNDSPEPHQEYGAILERDQIRLADADQTDKMVFWGIEIGKRSTLAMMLVGGGTAVRARKMASRVELAEAREMSDKLSRLEEVMASPGLDAFAATSREMDWLLRKSFGLGCTLVPSSVESGDMLTETDLSAFAKEVSWAVKPLADSVEVTSTQNGGAQRRYNVILTLTNLPELNIPEQDEPWIARTDRLGFPVEWSIKYTKEAHEVTAQRMLKQLDKIRAQERHYRVDHEMDPPQQLARQAAHAHTVEDEMRVATDLNTRVVGHVRVAVSADTEEEAIRRVKALQKLYSRKGEWKQLIGQYHLAKEFVPMETISDKGAQRRMSVLKLAAGVPMAATEWGDREGISLGSVKGMSRQAAIWNPWWGPEHNESGFTPIIAGLGGGKTNLASLIVWKTACQGAGWTILDPSSLMSNIAKLPGMRDFSRVVNLLNSESGALNPYALVADPRLADFEEEEDPEREYQREVRKAQSQRRQLAMEVLTGCLPGEDHDDDLIRRTMREAINESPVNMHSTLDGVMETLKKMSEKADSSRAEVASNLYRTFSKKRDGELPRLFFASGSTTNDGGPSATTARVTFYGLKGLVAPPTDANIKYADWSEEQLLYNPILNLAGWATLREVYRKPRAERKGVVFDEFLELAKMGTGQQLAQKASTDSRKHNLVALALAQSGKAIIDSDVTNFVGSAFLGRTQAEDAQIANCQIAGIPADKGYTDMFAKLSEKKASALRDDSRRKDDTPREFIAKDYAGNIEKVVIDQRHHEAFMAAADSSPRSRERLDIRDTEKTEEAA